MQDTETDTPASIANRHALLSVQEMYQADSLAIEAGVSGIELMAEAGSAVANAAMDRWPKEQFVVLCGPGNNGGDGFVAARYLMAAGKEVSLYTLGDLGGLKGDAAHHAALWRDVSDMEPVPLSEVPEDHDAVVIDALFGAGLARPIEGALEQQLRRIVSDGKGVLAVDLPSGLNGDTGEAFGYAPQADLTVTFFRKKPGHLLYPGRRLTGDLIVADIGTPQAVLQTISPGTFENHPELWNTQLPKPNEEGHKYQRGHLVVLGGERMTGAARLASRAARRAGAGLATVATKPSAFEIYAKGDPGTMVETFDSIDGFDVAISDPRRNAVLIGPGAGVGAETQKLSLAALKGGEKTVVLDADALTSFQGQPSLLFSAIRGSVVLTPHEGEFARLFDSDGDKLDRARTAARVSGAVILLKGADTIVASPDGRACINSNAPPDLATAGSGDVLAGIIAGLVTQGMPAFEAATAGAWIHGAAGCQLGTGLIAEDLCEVLPQVFAEIRL